MPTRTDFGKNVADARIAHNIPVSFNEIRNKELAYINAHKLKFPTNVLANGIGYVFITKPSLNIITPTGGLAANVPSIPFFENLYKRSAGVLENLCYEYKASPFVNILSNKCTSFDIGDEVLKTHDKGETFLGWKISYGKHAVESRTGYGLSLSFDENKDLDVYNVIKAWVMYIESVNRGIISPAQYNIENFILDYAASVYYFVLAPDNLNIKFYAKMTGVFPTNIPNSVFSASELKKIDSPKYSINFNASFVEAMDPRILSEFNQLGSSGSLTNLYNPSTLGPSDPWVAGAAVMLAGDRFQLKFKK